MNKPLISITVCVRDGVNWIDDCMVALCAQTHRPLEIIAVDDGSTDGSREKLLQWNDEKAEQEKSNGIPVRVLTQEPLGLSAGRNYSLNEANGDWVAITDIDCRPRVDWIERLFSSSKEVEAVTGRVIFNQGRTSVSKLRARSIAWKYSSRSENTTLANGPCSMFKRESLISRGGFDPSWYHAEDMEVSMKILQSGELIRYEPEAVVDHVAEESLFHFLSKRRRDARAHTRIMRYYRGVKHDFSNDGKIIVFFLLPFIVLIASITTFSDILYPVMAIMLFMILFRNYLLWSAALWLGAFEGCIDALLGKNGHKPLFRKQV
ncbi:MAG: glycosyltransferase family 2 protein [Euryarchaeota archaeon]|nr:glycosyltransferase family 2 protein [Euryarchaeota archaeon]